MSKQKVRVKIGPLENNSGNIISNRFQMAEVLNEYFSSGFHHRRYQLIPVPITKFEGDRSDHLGQLSVKKM